MSTAKAHVQKRKPEIIHMPSKQRERERERERETGGREGGERRGGEKGER